MIDRYLLDTDWASYLVRGEPLSVIETVRNLPPDRLYISLLSLAELYYGAFNSTNPPRFLQAIADLRTRLRVVPFDREEISRRYGEIRAELRRQGTLIGIIDTLLAATCLEHAFTLLTNNRRHFERVSGLEIISA